MKKINNYEKKVKKVMVNKMNNHLSPQTITHTQKRDHDICQILQSILNKHV